MGARSTSRRVAFVAGGGAAALAAVLALARSFDERGEPVRVADGLDAGRSSPSEPRDVALASAEPARSAVAEFAGTPAERAELSPAAADGRRALPVGLRGRVAVEDGAGVAGVELVVAFAGSEQARALTGADGSFAFAADAPTDLGFVRPRKYGWRFRPWRVRLRSVEPGTALHFAAEELALAPLRVRLVDARTAEPLPRLRVRIEGEPGVKVEVASSDAGLVDAGVEIEIGTATLVPLEGRSGALAVPHGRLGPGEAIPDVAVVIGPTYHFDLDVPRGTDLSELDAVLAPVQPRSVPGLARALECGALLDARMPFSADYPDGAPLASIRPGGPRDGGAWARFDECLPSGYAPARTAEGYELLVVGPAAFGRARVPSLVGVCPEIVRVALEPGGAIAGRARFPWFDGPRPQQGFLGSRAPVSFLPRITLRTAGGMLVGATVPDERGRFAFGPLVPGVYEVTAESALAGTARASVAVAAGKPTPVELMLPRDPTVVFAEGVVRGQAGAPFAVQLDLVSRDDPELRFQTRATTWGLVPRSGPSASGEGAAYEVPFAFRGVPPGAYELRVRSSDGARWTPERIAVSAPTSGLLIAHVGAVPTAAVRFDVRDAESGEPAPCVVQSWIAGVDMMPTSEDLVRVPAPARGRWIAVGPGYAPAGGTWAVDDGERELVVDVPVRRGAGVVVLTVTPWGERVPGVEVLQDGALAGRTDEDGVLLLERASPSSSFDARRAGWVAAPSAHGEGLGSTILPIHVAVLVRE